MASKVKYKLISVKTVRPQSRSTQYTLINSCSSLEDVGEYYKYYSLARLNILSYSYIYTYHRLMGTDI